MSSKKTQYAKTPTPDLYRRIKEIEDQQDDLRKGIIYLDGLLSDVNHPSWKQNHREWALYKRADKSFIGQLENRKQVIYAELRRRGKAVEGEGAPQWEGITKPRNGNGKREASPALPLAPIAPGAPNWPNETLYVVTESQLMEIARIGTS